MSFDNDKESANINRRACLKGLAGVGGLGAFAGYAGRARGRGTAAVSGVTRAGSAGTAANVTPIVREQIPLPMGCPPGEPGNRPPMDKDVDGDGTPDGWLIHEQTDENGNTIEVVCVNGSYHLLRNGQSIGKCPWPGGRNSARKYGNDADGDGQVDEYGWFYWESWDGPLPGEQLNGFEVTHDNYGEFDEDGDGLIDITEYTYHLDRGVVVKRHYELDWTVENPQRRERPEDREEFPPQDYPYDVPDDYAGTITGEGPPMAHLDTGRLPTGIATVTTREVTVETTAYDVPLSITNGGVVAVEALSTGVAVSVVPTHDEGRVEVTLSTKLLAALGTEVGAPVEVVVDGESRSFERNSSPGEADVFVVPFQGNDLRVEIRYPAPESPTPMATPTPTDTPTTAPTPTATPTPTPTVVPGFGLVAGVLAAVVAALVGRYRRED